MLTEQEQRTLDRMERRLRAEDERFTRRFEMFCPDLYLVLPYGSELSPATKVAQHVLRSLAVALLLLIPVVWLVALISTGELATVSRMALLPVSALLLALCCALNPDLRWRARRRRVAVDGDRG